MVTPAKNVHNAFPITEKITKSSSHREKQISYIRKLITTAITITITKIMIITKFV